MSPSGAERRYIYLAFQGLLAAVLLLYLGLHRDSVAGWEWRLTLLAAALAASFVPLARLSPQRLGGPWFQAGLFVADALLASLVLLWTDSRQSDLYLTYFLIILGTALTRSFRQSLGVALAASVFYVFTVWDPESGLPAGSRFWLRVPYLWIMAFVAGAISLDSRRTQTERERAYRKRLLRMERRAAMGQLAGEVAHRLKGPLTAILVNAELLAAKKEKASAKVLAQIREAVARCRETLDGLLDLGRLDRAELVPVDLAETAGEALAAGASVRERRGVRLEREGLDRPARVLGDAALLYEAVACLLQNAVEAMPEGGTLRVSLCARRDGGRLTPEEEGGRDGFALVVADTGRGMAAGELERAFEPFYTTKPGGSGLGLASAARIAAAHDGAVDAASDGPGKGARFTLFLPRAR